MVRKDRFENGSEKLEDYLSVFQKCDSFVRESTGFHDIAADPGKHGKKKILIPLDPHPPADTNNALEDKKKSKMTKEEKRQAKVMAAEKKRIISGNAGMQRPVDPGMAHIQRRHRRPSLAITVTPAWMRMHS